MALVLPLEIYDSTFGRMLLVYRKTFFYFNGQYECPIVLPVVHKQFLHLLVMTTSVSLLVQDILITVGSTMLIVCGMVSSVEQSKEGVVELLVYHGSTRHYPLPPVTTLNLGSAVIRELLLACMRFMWSSVLLGIYSTQKFTELTAAWYYFSMLFLLL